MSNKFRSKHKLTVAKSIMFVVFMIYALSILFLFAWAIMISLKSREEYFTHMINFFPRSFRLQNYVDAFKQLSASGNNVILLIWNSLWRSLGAVFINLFVSATTAYVVAKFKFPCRNLIYTIALAIMMVPVIGSLPAQYKLYTDLGILDSPLMLVTAASGFGFNFLIMYSCFKNLSRSYAESAYIDGAGHFGVFFKIDFPQIFPPMIALSILSFVGYWNSYEDTLLFMESYPTVTSGLYIYQLEIGRMINYPMLFAGILMSALPIVIIFITCQNVFMEMDLSGGLKG